MELCVASIPKQAIYDVGGVEEKFDMGAALSEKEMCIRINKAGYSFWLDQSIEYRALKHPRLTPEWDEKYKIACAMYENYLHDILNGTRLKLDYLKGGELKNESSSKEN